MCSSKFGAVDVLVNTTQGGWHGKFFECREADWDKAIDRGLKAYFLTCQQFGRVMAERGKGGKIINITSIVGVLGSGQAVPWGAARGGVNSLTAAVAQALGPYGINCTALARGATDSTSYSDAAKAERLRRLPMGRLGREDDIVGPAIFLATSDSDWVTGSVIYCDGGYVTAAATDDEYRPGQGDYRAREAVSGDDGEAAHGEIGQLRLVAPYAAIDPRRKGGRFCAALGSRPRGRERRL